jgi:hypothetical protein
MVSVRWHAPSAFRDGDTDRLAELQAESDRVLGEAMARLAASRTTR